jgi:uncharacterized protein with beta-barrel porin domain
MTGLALDITQTAVTHYSLSQAAAAGGDSSLSLTMTTNFMPAGLANMTPNQIEAATYLNAIQTAGDSPALYGTVASIASLSTGALVAQSYDLLTADSYVATQATPVYDSNRFSEALLSCKQFEGEHRFIDEGNCAWMNVSGSTRKEDATRLRFGGEQNTSSVTAGLQRALTDQVHLGLGFSLDDTEIVVGRDRTSVSTQKATGDGLQLGAVLKGNFGAHTLSTSFAAGHTNYTATRGSFRDNLLTDATSDYATNTLAAHLRYGYAIEGKRAYVRPLLDAGFTQIRRDAFTETGSGPTNLVVEGSSDEIVTLQPAIEIGGEVGLPSGAKMRGFVRGGVTRLLSGEDVSLTARFESAPLDIAPMTFTDSLDKQSTDLAAGIDVLTASGLALRLMYSSTESDHAKTQMGTLKVSAGF